MVTEDELRRIALALPGAEEGEADRLAFTVGGKGFAWSWMERTEKKKPRVERRDVLAVRVENEGEKQALLAMDSSKFFTEDHYNGFPAILVRLDTIEADELGEMLLDAWRTRALNSLLREFETAHSNSDQRTL